VDGAGELARGREAGRRLAWADAYAAFSLAQQSSLLAAADLELMATAAYLLGRLEDCHKAMQRASRAYFESGDPRRAARCLFWVAFTLLLQGDVAQAGGWLARASRLLEHERPECAEHGFLLLPEALQALMTGDHAKASAAAARAAEIGARVGDADLLALALHFHGRALVADGRMAEGLALLDEAMVAVVAGELSPYVAGNIYCSMIDACQEISDLRRAGEWTTALTRWCGEQPDMIVLGGDYVTWGDRAYVGPCSEALGMLRAPFGVYAVVGVLAALVERERTGRGTLVDAALIDSQVGVLANQALNYLVSGNVPKRQGNSHPNIVPYQVFPVADGHIIIATGNDSQYQKLCAVLGEPELAHKAEYRDNSGRLAHREELVTHLCELCKRMKSADLLAKLEAVGVPAGPINDLDEVFADPQVIDRGLQLRLPSAAAKGGEIPGVRTPIMIGGLPMAAERPSPRLGEHTAEILKEIGEA